MLPEGLRDLLPERAARRRAIASTVLATYARWGYATVTLPAFERESVVARAVGGAVRRELVRFLDPDTGDVLVLRPDMTPQIARLVATRYREHPGPIRLSYEGSVVRRPRGRARRERQVSQAGVECISHAAPAADVEVIAATVAALREAGVRDLSVELSHALAAPAVVDGLAPHLRDPAAAALASRDRAEWHAILDGDACDHLDLLARCAGTPDVLEREGAALVARGHRDVVSELRSVADALAGCGADLLVDLGELRGRGYYTGLFFQVLRDGVGVPLAAGGRYDALLGRYGTPRPATGAAIDLEAVEEALRGSASAPPSKRVLVVGAADARRVRAAELRAEGRSVAECDPMDPDDLAALVVWEGFAEVVTADGG